MTVPVGAVVPGPGNALTDVAGIRVGHAQRTDAGWRTGVTVVLSPPGGATCGVDVRGAAPGTRETDLLDPRNLVDRVHAIVLSGGSAYGLAAADGVMAWLADAGIGYKIGEVAGEIVPIVPAAVIFDLGRGGSFRATPGAAMGAAACEAPALGEPGGAEQGSIGAGTGAKVGGFAGGTGMASAALPGGTTVAALAVVNASGSPADPATGELYGARFGLDGEFTALAPPGAAELAAWRGGGPSGAGGPGSEGRGSSPFNTTIGVLATDAALTKAQCARLAVAGHDGIARAIRPAHTMVDGDTVFGLSCADGEEAGLAAFQALLGVAADVFSRAIAHAVLAASGRPGAPSYRDVFPSAVSGTAASR
jgi:L-aminopeptidase/D-esterase-like protein